MEISLSDKLASKRCGTWLKVDALYVEVSGISGESDREGHESFDIGRSHR